MDWNYVIERVECYNRNPSDDLLYRIGTHVLLINPSQHGSLSPQQRYRILNWLTCSGFQIEPDLALLIFGRDKLTQWLEQSRLAYPNYELYLPFEFFPKSRKGWESGINFALYWMPKEGAPVPDPQCDFPWKPHWDLGEMFWGNLPNGTKNDLEFTLSVYPDQRSFTIPGEICSSGDYYTTPTDEERDLMSVAQVLQHFAAVSPGIVQSSWCDQGR
jgi:hypothetical protein